MAAVNCSPAVASRRAKYDGDFRVPTPLGAQPLDHTACASPTRHVQYQYRATVHIKSYISSFLLHRYRVVYHLSRQRPSPPRFFSPACFRPPGFYSTGRVVTRCAPSFGRWCETSTVSAAAASSAATHLGSTNVFYHEALGGKYVPRAVHQDLEPGVIGAVTSSRRSANSSARKTS
jgi:hypothetical protein